jgi:hypothetical protein
MSDGTTSVHENRCWTKIHNDRDNKKHPNDVGAVKLLGLLLYLL